MTLRIVLPAVIAVISCLICSGLTFAAGTPFLNVDAAGAKGDGATDDSAAIQAAFARSRNVTCTAGKAYYVAHTVTIWSNDTTVNAKSCVFSPHLSPSVNPVFDIEASNVTLNGLVVRAGSGGWAVFAGMTRPVSRVTVNDETCDGSDNAPMSGCNQIASVTGFRINGWTDISSGYGLLQRSGTNSHNVSVAHFRSRDMYGDLIAENSVSGTSSAWSISDGTFEGSHRYPTPATEQRFASFTTADGISISNVSVQHVNGDSAVHLEGTARNVILTNDMFKDNLSTGGSDAYVTYNNSANNIRASQIKCIFSLAGNAPYCFGGAANAYSNKLDFTNVECQDISRLRAFSCFELAFHSGSTTIRDGGGTGLLQFILTKNTTNLSVSGATAR